MKFSNVVKVVGAAALIAGLTPYRVTTDEDTGEKKVRALFWKATSGQPNEGAGKGGSFQVGFFSPMEKDEESHFFADELTVEYTRQEVSDTNAEEPDTEEPDTEELDTKEPDTEETEDAAPEAAANEETPPADEEKDAEAAEE